jgi:glycosyltransferase involved in cell wall biosynthesis
MTALISCIMPTHDRRTFVPRAIDCFLHQDYPNRELVIVDDGHDRVADLVPADPRIRYLPLDQRLTIGAKRNLAIEHASGTLIAHWDDDDWHAPRRLSYQVDALMREQGDICGIQRMLFYEQTTGQFWLYEYPATERHWLIGGSLVYTRPFWAQAPFPPIQVGEDTRFLLNHPLQRAVVLADHTFYVATIHPANTSAKNTQGAYWSRWDGDLAAILGESWSSMADSGISGEDRPGDSPLPEAPAARINVHDRSVAMLTVARAGDLGLPEFAALNHGQSLPWMRRWEQPFALFQAQLSNTMAVLDCTINPVDFRDRLNRLYPNVLYRHWSPIQGGQFVLPFGVPDQSFDRVICINTLEHLLQPQRVELIAALAAKLKPDGWLILTSDFYFDSAWDQPAFVQAGVMRADRTEIFNGWNKLRFADWLELCSPHGLRPMAAAPEEPAENELTLYRNPQPFPHACIGGVFSRVSTEQPSSRKIVLGMLTWNTCEVSIDSLRAYLREAQMLRRLGQVPVLCVCDNGSTDGTAEALRAFEADASAADIPYRLILNPTNLGNSIGRNQIIDYLLECAGDYLLFMDGDIEIVPFSSFAMLRYMESCGQRLGCIGADSASQTPIRQRASAYLYSIDGRIETTNLVAWTQYGMFRRALFDEGIRFDETEPFNGAGWGFEDNDMAFQMEVKGYINQRFFGMTYLHRNIRSSIRVMRQQGIDAAAIYDRRKQYVIDKWAPVTAINTGPLQYVRRVQFQL